MSHKKSCGGKRKKLNIKYKLLDNEKTNEAIKPILINTISDYCKKKLI